MSFRIKPGPFIPPSSLEDPPLIPGEYDDEFDGSSLDPSWTRVGSFDDVNAIDPYVAISTGGHRTSLNNWRKSWYMGQPGTSGSIVLRKLVTFPTNCFVWLRGSFNMTTAAQANNDATIRVFFSPDDGAVTNSVSLCLNESDVNTIQVEASSWTGGASTSLGVTNNIGGAGAAQAQPACYIGIQKVGTTYHFWSATEGGNWMYVANVVHATTFDRILLLMSNATSPTPGNMIMGFDFLRFVSGKYLP